MILAGTLRFVPETRDPHVDKRLDILGITTSSLGFGASIFSLIEAQHYGWFLQSNGSISPVLFTLITGVVSIAAFLVIQLRKAAAKRTALIDISIFKIASFRIGSIAALVVVAGEFGLLFSLPPLLQNALGYSALGTGWLIVSLALGTFIISGATPHLSSRIGGKRVVQIGLITEAVSVGLLAAILHSGIATWPFAVLLFCYGLGVGMATAQLTSLILSEVPIQESGQASGLQSTIRQLGAAVGVACMGAILVGTLARYTTNNLTQTHIPRKEQPAIVQIVKSSAGSAIPRLQEVQATSAAGDIAAQGLVYASKVTLGIASVAITVGALATIPLRDKRAGL